MFRSIYRLPFIILTIIISYNSAYPNQIDDERLVVMSFNVDASISEDTSYNSWENRRNLVLQTIRHANPDLIGFQELTEDQLTYLKNELPEYKAVGKNNGDTEKPLYNSIFYDKKKLRMLQSGIFWLSESPDQVASKGWGCETINTAVWASFRYGRYEFLLVNTEFDEKNKTAQLESAKILWQQIHQITEGQVVITGTLNANANSEALAYLFNKLPKPKTTEEETDEYAVKLPDPNFVDAFRTAKTMLGTNGYNTNHGYKGILTKSDSGRVDWVLVKPSIYVETTEILTYREKSRYPSDHFPIVSNIVFAPKSGDWSDSNKPMPVAVKKEGTAYNFEDTTYIRELREAAKKEREEAEKRAREYEASKQQ